MRNLAILVVASISLAGCGDDKTGPTFIVSNEIKNISFMGAHQDERCSKGCRYEFVADTWFIQLCSIKDSSDCVTRKIYHAPWSWQQVGVKVTVTWQPRGSWNSFVSVMLTDTGEKVAM